VLFNAPEWSLNPIEDTNQTAIQQYQQGVGYPSSQCKRHAERNTTTTKTRTQSPILTINQLVRPRLIVNKKEAVTAVSQTKIMLLIVLLLICLLIRWLVPRQSRHVAHYPTSAASRCLQKTNPLSVLFRDPFLCKSYHSPLS
jgi:hypothetical protein